MSLDDNPRWKIITSLDDLQTFYESCVPKLKAVAKEHGYALGFHGSFRRDLDVIAVPWVASYSSPDLLANALMKAASGFTQSSITWDTKPNGRIATALPICIPRWEGCHSIISLGHLDLSVMIPNLNTSNEHPNLPAGIKILGYKCEVFINKGWCQDDYFVGSGFTHEEALASAVKIAELNLHVRLQVNLNIEPQKDN